MPTRRKRSRVPARTASTKTQTTPDVFVFDRAGIRAVDSLATRVFGVPSVVLMENAARHAADVALDLVEGNATPTVAVFCGGGNNAGDGFAVARHLANAGLDVRLGMLTPIARLKGDALTNATIAKRMGLSMSSIATRTEASVAKLAKGADLIIDALFGTGLDRPLAGAALAIVRAINRAAGKGPTPVLSLDVPSGLDADTGAALGDAIKADVTVTFAGLKRGFLIEGAWPYLGETIIADIGAPRELLERLGTRLPLNGA